MALPFLTGRAALKGLSMASKYFKKKKSKKPKEKTEPVIDKDKISNSDDIDHTTKEVKSTIKGMSEYKKLTAKQKKELEKEFKIEPK